MDKIAAYNVENKKHINESMKGPQQTKKKQKWAASTMRANNPQGQGYYRRSGLRETSYEIKSEWQNVADFNKQRQDKLPSLTPGVLGVETEAGRIHDVDTSWLKVKFSQSKKLPNLNQPIPDISIINDDYIQEIAQSGKAQVFISDVAAAAIMCSQKANYSWDVKITKFQ